MQEGFVAVVLCPFRYGPSSFASVYPRSPQLADDWLKAQVSEKKISAVQVDTGMARAAKRKRPSTDPK